jgi:hypothetical protein
MVAVIPRSAWGARHENGFADRPLPVQRVYLHHSVTIAPDLLPPFTDDDAAVRTLELIGEQRFGGGISYTWPITPVGRVYEGHSVHRRGAHTGGQNTTAAAIVFVGDYDRNRPTGAQIESAAQLLVQEYRARRIVSPRIYGGHRDAPGASTACPGRYAMEAIPTINARAAALLAGAPEEDDVSAADVWKSFFTITAGPGEGQKVTNGVAMREIYQNGVITKHTVIGLQAAVAEMAKALTALAGGSELDAEKLVADIGARVSEEIAKLPESVEVEVSVRDDQPAA